MNHNNPFDGSEMPVEMYAEPERTSIAAILSLVLGILGCCGGLTSIFGIIFGVFGILGISRSKGRVGGMGFAIAGLLVSLLTLAIWVGLLIGSNWAYANVIDNQVMQPTAQVLMDLEADNFDAARTGLGSPAADLSDEELIAFRDSYTSALGNYSGKPAGWLEYFQGFSALGPQFQQHQPPPIGMPLVLYFDNGSAIVVPETFADGAGGYTPPSAIVIIDQNGDIHKLPAD